MMITYDNFPSLLFLSYNKDNAPGELPFEVDNESARYFLSRSKGFNDLFSTIAALNTFGKKPEHYYLDNAGFNNVEHNDSFRGKHFRNFFSNLPMQEKYGTILFRDGGQYVYLFLPGAAYFATALFKGNIFLGFEEAVIQGGLIVQPTGYYTAGMDKGGYLSFVSIALSHLSRGTVLLTNKINHTGEEVFANE